MWRIRPVATAESYARLTYRLWPLKSNYLDGGRGFYIYDPDGHNIEFITRTYSDALLAGSAARHGMTSGDPDQV